MRPEGSTLALAKLLAPNYPAACDCEATYLRRDKSSHGVFYASGKPGPAGAYVRSPSWSPVGTHLVYSRYETKRSVEPRKLWSRNSAYELSITRWLPAYDPTGEHFAVTGINALGRPAMFVEPSPISHQCSSRLSKMSTRIRGQIFSMLYTNISRFGDGAVHRVGMCSMIRKFLAGASKLLLSAHGENTTGSMRDSH
jgi:hypothetical protein